MVDFSSLSSGPSSTGHKRFILKKEPHSFRTSVAVYHSIRDNAPEEFSHQQQNDEVFEARKVIVFYSMYFLHIIKPIRCTNFSNLFLEYNSTCLGQFLCPSSAVFHCTHSNGICHTGLPTACEYSVQYSLRVVSKPFSEQD